MFSNDKQQTHSKKIAVCPPKYMESRVAWAGLISKLVDVEA